MTTADLWEGGVGGTKADEVNLRRDGWKGGNLVI